MSGEAEGFFRFRLVFFIGGLILFTIAVSISATIVLRVTPMNLYSMLALGWSVGVGSILTVVYLRLRRTAKTTVTQLKTERPQGESSNEASY
jgi:hypothetical protein